MKCVKRCGCCGREYSIPEFLKLRQPSGGEFQIDDVDPILLILRNCVCGSTMAIETEVRSS
jgi:hypothetical protein